MTTSTDQVRRYFDRHAAHFDRVMTSSERLLLGRHRRWAVDQVHGDVLEVGVGTGLNLPLYAAGTRVVGLELAAGMAALAQQRASAVPVTAQVELVVGDAQQLPFGTASFDTVVSTYTLCSIPEPERAVAEAIRVLRPGGRLVLLEHGLSTRPWLARAQRLVEPAFQRWQAEHVSREHEQYVQLPGLTAVEVERAGRGDLVYKIVATRS